MGPSGLFNILLITILTTLTPIVVPQQCGYSQQMVIGKTYFVSNPEYPGNYKAGTNCMWSLESPPGTNIVISCNVNLPSTNNCVGDKLKLSLTGDATFADSKNYCGTGSISFVTNGQRVAVGLTTVPWSSGGRFVCSVTSIKDPNSDNGNSTPSPDICECGWKKGTKIVGGVPTLVNEYPAMAALINIDIQEILCGCAIISNRYLLTAAHCMRAIPLQYMAVLVGDWNISTGADTPASALYAVERYFEHPLFDVGKQTNDIAIVKTKKPIVFSLAVGPICLPFLHTFENFDGATVTEMGWGQQFFGGPQSDTLEKINLTIVPLSTCRQQLAGNVVTDKQMCTFAVGKDSCTRDSGGPVIWQDPETVRLQLIGVISYGFGCATNKPGVITRVTSYLQWIVSVTSDTNYCVK